MTSENQVQPSQDWTNPQISRWMKWTVFYDRLDQIILDRAHPLRKPGEQSLDEEVLSDLLDRVYERTSRLTNTIVPIFFASLTQAIEQSADAAVLSIQAPGEDAPETLHPSALDWRTLGDSVFMDDRSRDAGLSSNDWLTALKHTGLDRVTAGRDSSCHGLLNGEPVAYEFDSTVAPDGTITVDAGCYRAWPQGETGEVLVDHQMIIGQALIRSVPANAETLRYLTGN